MSINILRTVHSLLLFVVVVWKSQCNGCGPTIFDYYIKERHFDLSIIHMNDFHARFEEVNDYGWPCERHTEKQCFGGLPRTLTVARQLKKEHPNSILLNAGDHYQGTIWYNVYKWNATAEFLNMLPNDVMTIGNHDFDGDIAGLVPFLQHVNVPVVLSNIITEHEPTLKNLLRKSYVIEKDGRKIGFIGVIFQDVWSKSSTGNTWFLNEIETINSQAKKLKAQGVNIIIVLSHCGIMKDREIAAQCPDVDVIVGGHSHTFLYTGQTLPPYNVPEDEYPVVVMQDNTRRLVLIVQAYAFTKYLGHLSVRFDEDGEILTWKGAPILLDETIEEDKDMLRRLEPYKKTIDSLKSVVVGKTENVLINNCKYRECALGDMITDAMVASYVDRAEGNDWTYAAIAITYVGGLKKSIKPENGIIKYGDIAQTLPFGDTWDVIEVEGHQIRKALELSFSTSVRHDKRQYYSYFAWSGIDVVYDTTENALSRVVEVKVRCQNCPTPIYEHLRDRKWYRIVVPEFLANNGGQSTLAQTHMNRVKGDLDIDKLAVFITALSPLNYERDCRIFFCDRSRNKHCGKNYRKFTPHQSIFSDSLMANIKRRNHLTRGDEIEYKVEGTDHIESVQVINMDT